MIAGSGAAGFAGTTGVGGGATIREIGGRIDFVTRGVPSARLGRGCFSSISETVSTGARVGGGGGTAFAAAAAAAAAGRGLAAGGGGGGGGCAAFHAAPR